MFKLLLGLHIWSLISSAWSTHLVSDQIRPGRVWGSTPFSFLTVIMERGAQMYLMAVPISGTDRLHSY